MDMIEPEQTQLVLASADRLSQMADSVAAFSISSSLLLIFACLKDIGRWVRAAARAFRVGTLVGGMAYLMAIWLLYWKEHSIRMTLEKDAPAGIGAALPTINDVALSLAGARSLGVVAFTLIGVLVIWGTERGPHAEGH